MFEFNFLKMNTWIAYFIYLYLGLGLIWSLYFVFIGVNKLDADMKSASLSMRLILIPGSIGLWPLLMYKTLNTNTL